MAGDASDSVATSLVKLARVGAELFHFGENCFATIVVANHQETYPLKGRSFRGWLSHIYFEEKNRAASGEALASAIATLEGYSRFQSEERGVFVRVGEWDGRIYLDLANEHWQVVEISRKGWRVVESKDCPVCFVRPQGMQLLPTPERGGKIGELRAFLNIGSESDFRLVVGFLLGALHPQGPYPILILHGEQGSAKTTAAKILRELSDPNLAPVRSEPREARDLMIAANNSWIVSFDNISSLAPWLSDCLCRLSTGGGFSTRTLYTDDEERIFQAKQPVILNGIEELATRGDLLDRSLTLYLPRIPDEQRRDKRSFDAAFDAARPRILGALLHAVSTALANIDSVKLETLPRMADFSIWVTAAESSLGWERYAFLAAYSENRRAANDLPLETSVVDALRKLALPWTGTATTLLRELEGLADERTRHSRSWPASGRALSNNLRRLVPNLRCAGIHVAFDREPGTGKRLITITDNTGNPSSQASQMPPGCDRRDECDDDKPLSSGVSVAVTSPRTRKKRVVEAEV